MAENKYISELSGNTNPSLTGYTVYDDGASTYKVTLQTLKDKLFSASSSYATLSGNTFNGSQTINGDLVVTGSITAQQYIVSSSVYHIVETTVSGSSNFGNSFDDTHIFTGSLNVTGSITTRGTVNIGTGSIHEESPEVLSVANSGSFNIAYFTGKSDTYAQINIQNVSDNSGASTDLVLTADNGSETNHYVNLGINSSGWMMQTASIGYQNDAYLYNVGQDLYIGTMEPASPDHGHLHLFSSNSWDNPQITIFSEKTIAFNTGSVTTGFTYEFSGSVKINNGLTVDGNQIITGSIYMETGSIVLPNGTEIYDTGDSDFGTTGIGLGGNGFKLDFGSNANDWARFVDVSNIQMEPTNQFGIIITGVGEYGWFFNGSGMSFPDGTIQTTAFTGFTEGLISGSSQIQYSGLTGIPSGIISGSSQILDGSGIWSGSAQLPSGIISGSSQLPSGLVSGSSQISYTGITDTPNGLISGSSQISNLGYAITGSNTFIGDQTINGSLIIGGVSEILTVDGGFNSNRTFDYTSGSIFYLTGLTGNGVWNIENVPTTDNKALALTYVIEQGVTAYSGSQYQINGSNVTVKWVDNTIPTGSANNTEVIGLTAFRVGSSWNVIGSLSTFGV
jgi:hypothetical protein